MFSVKIVYMKTILSQKKVKFLNTLIKENILNLKIIFLRNFSKSKKSLGMNTSKKNFRFLLKKKFFKIIS
jgi:hypothetical protein